MGAGCKFWEDITFGGRGMVLCKGVVESLEDFWELNSTFEIECSHILPFPPGKFDHFLV
jgi:hypothetical protein